MVKAGLIPSKIIEVMDREHLSFWGPITMTCVSVGFKGKRVSGYLYSFNIVLAGLQFEQVSGLIWDF